MTTQRQILLHCDTASPLALLGNMVWHIREALASSLDRRHLAQELSRLDNRELADLRLQPHDIDLLIHGRPVPAMEFMRRSR